MILFCLFYYSSASAMTFLFCNLSKQIRLCRTAIGNDEVIWPCIIKNLILRYCWCMRLRVCYPSPRKLWHKRVPILRGWCRSIGLLQISERQKVSKYPLRLAVPQIFIIFFFKNWKDKVRATKPLEIALTTFLARRIPWKLTLTLDPDPWR